MPLLILLWLQKAKIKQQNQKKNKIKYTNYLRFPLQHTENCNYDTNGDGDHDFHLSNI